MKLIRYWFEFEFEEDVVKPGGLGIGCGVTAISRDDAHELILDGIFSGMLPPRIKSVIEDVDVSRLDSVHVIPNMGDVLKRGIWFPKGYG